KKMNLIDPEVVHGSSVGEGFSFYIVYGKCNASIDSSLIVTESLDTITKTKEEIEELIVKSLGRNLVFVGASTGSDAHTVGIDAIMNMKGYAGHYGLERYLHVEAYNMGSQVTNEEFIKKAKEVKADVLLVSQTVTQKEVHIKNLIELVELLEAENMRKDVVLICGGARITHELAKELGYDAGFGPGKFAEDVASFALDEVIKKNLQKTH
ncbi:MAG: cobalamin-dependent protein, partial [Candidatus Izemoplasmatales bacterium]|nr:cobalamin-dependent protein [Candidatus Izemoplasmatales bacterium]